MKKSYKKILLIKVGGLGDFVLATPSFRLIYYAFPEAEISLLTNFAYLELLENCPYISKVLTYDRKEGWKALFRKGRELRDIYFDLVIDLQNNFRTNLLTFLSKSPERIGFRRGFRPLFLTNSIPLPEETLDPVSQQFYLFKESEILPHGALMTNKKLEVWLSEEREIEAEDLLKESGYMSDRLLIGLHPGAGTRWLTKRWLPERWAELIQILLQKGFQVAFFGEEREKEEIAEIVNLINLSSLPSNIFNFTGRTSLGLLAALLKRCSHFISTDSGPLYLSLACGCKTIGLFGPTESKRHLPEDGIVVEKDLSCRPCYRHTCPNFDCMRQITVQDILIHL